MYSFIVLRLMQILLIISGVISFEMFDRTNGNLNKIATDAIAPVKAEIISSEILIFILLKCALKYKIKAFIKALYSINISKYITNLISPPSEIFICLL